MKYYINKLYMTGLYWSTLLNCRAHANIHIVVIRCLFNCSCQVLLCLFRYWEESAQYIYLHICPNTPPQLQVHSAAFALKRWLLLNCIQEAWSATAPHWSNRSIAGSYIRSYEIKRLLDNKKIFFSLIVSALVTKRESSETEAVES